MKTGYYNVVDERIYPNGDTDTLYYKMVGPLMYGDNWNVIEFIGDFNGNTFDQHFMLPTLSSKTENSINISFTIQYFSTSTTELIVYRESDDVLGYSNKITFTYIE